MTYKFGIFSAEDLELVKHSKNYALIDFDIGEKVILNSGGPAMTVTSVDLKEVSCKWFYGGSIYAASFDPVVLEKVI